MYTSHFGLSEPPFSITPDPRYLYMSERHREGLAHLFYGIRQPGGFVQLTGEVGTGKTTLCRCLLDQLPPDVDVALVLNPRLTAVELLATVCDDLKIVYPNESVTVKVLVDALYRHLLDAHTQGRRTVLIIDEAQNLPPEVLEQIRLLTNLETSTEKLLQIILIGQPELIRLLREQKLRQLAQRITARYHLLPFSHPETCAYIRHRVRVAGGANTLFTAAALRRVHRLSGGVPRLINVICDRALLGSYAHDQRRITAAMVGRAGREVRGAIPWAVRRRRLAWAIGLGAVGVAVIGWAVLVPPSQLPRLRSTSAPAVVGGGIGLTDASPRLAAILADPSASGEDAAFASLYSRWRLDYGKAGGGGCAAGRADGLECLFRVGNWNRVRRYDLPVLLELRTPAGERRRVALVALGEDNATLELGGREHTLPLGEIDRLWDGSFIVLWKAPPLASRLIAPGMRGQDVEWLRKRLDEVDGKVSTAPHPTLFESELKQRVLAFQRSRSLAPDGIVGEETLAELTLASREPGAPSLKRRGS